LSEVILLVMADIKLSVIVVCLNSSDVRDVCLRALDAQTHLDRVEILAVGHWGMEEKQLGLNGDHLSSREQFPTVRWLSVSTETTIPQMRTYAILQSCGEIVALLEDDCVISEGWIQNVVNAHTRADSIVGGAIAPEKYRRLLDWAVYFCEYGRFMPPFSGPQNALPGNHVTYQKTVLPSLESGQGFYEVFFHDAWRSSGGQLIADPKIVVTNVNHWSLRHVTSVPFHHGRAFAGMRAQSFPVWRRGLYTVLSLALPMLKATRLAAVVFNRQQYQVQFFLSLPWTMIFLSSWSLGELLGYAAGPGRSPEQWR
jgi:hypothetical protein